MWFFNLVLVTFASSIASTLYATIEHILINGTPRAAPSLHVPCHLRPSVLLFPPPGLCALVDIVSRAVPNTSILFLSYLLQDVLLVTPLVDMLQLLPLLMLALEALGVRLLRAAGTTPAI